MNRDDRRVAMLNENRRLRRLLFVFLWRDLHMCAQREPRWLRTIRWAKHALPERYRKALPKMNT